MSLYRALGFFIIAISFIWMIRQAIYPRTTKFVAIFDCVSVILFICSGFLLLHKIKPDRYLIVLFLIATIVFLAFGFLGMVHTTIKTKGWSNYEFRCSIYDDRAGVFFQKCIFWVTLLHNVHLYEIGNRRKQKHFR